MRQIVALGGGGFLMEEDPTLDDFVLSRTGRDHPRLCFVSTASGDSNDILLRYYRAFSGRARTTDLPLFRRDRRDLRAFLLEQDAIYVGGGNTANLLAIWRLHGVDVILREAWERGTVLAGVSAGALCWFEAGVTDSYGGLAPLTHALGFLPGSFCPHYDGEIERRPTFRRLVASGVLAPGYAADDSCAIHFADDAIAVARSKPTANAWKVERDGDVARETAL